ncbi:MAG: FapA family protein [candidate division Zixibacteria bacterium]|nr:FapA family protein [candidate division Zixibacteria bacterium]
MELTNNSSAFVTSASKAKGKKNGVVFELSLSPDEMKAYLLVQPSAEGYTKPTTEEVKSYLKEQGICFGLDEMAIQGMLEQKVYNQRIEVAHGEGPVSGGDAILEFLFNAAPDENFKIGQDERVDFKEHSIIQLVKKGQALVRKIPAKPGGFGTTVTGKKVLVRQPKDARLPVGLNSMPDPDEPLHLISRIEGDIIFKNQRVHIQPLRILKGNVDYTIGNVNYVGSLRVLGNIKKGFSITVDGNLEVEGSVGDARLMVGGDVLIKGGFLGSGKGDLDCRGKVIVKYIKNQLVTSAEDILIGGEVVGATLSANNNLKVVGPKGAIIGGDCAAGKVIEVNVLGDKGGTPTKIRVAYDRTLMEEYRQIEYELDKLNQDAQRVKGVLYTFEKMQMDGELSDRDKTVVGKLKNVESNIQPQMEKLKARRMELEKEINKNLDGKVIVKEKAYPGVELYFGILKYEIASEMGPTVFEIEEGRIRAKEYKV